MRDARTYDDTNENDIFMGFFFLIILLNIGARTNMIEGFSVGVP